MLARAEERFKREYERCHGTAASVSDHPLRAASRG
jgi:hypothetical protein